MTPLPEVVCYALKNRGDPLFPVCLTDEHAASGEVIGNRLVPAFAGKKRGGNQGYVVKPGSADRPRDFA